MSAESCGGFEAQARARMRALSREDPHAFAGTVDRGTALVGRNIEWRCRCGVGGISSSHEWCRRDHKRHVQRAEADE